MKKVLFYCGARLPVLLLIVTTMSLTNVTACTNDKEYGMVTDSETTDIPMNSTNNIKLTIGISSFTMVLYDNAAVKAFKALLPMSVRMGDMNGNEKYYYLLNALTTAPYAQRNIRSGDFMLWGDNCLVLFYKNFTSSYRYTRLGYIKDAAGLEAALGGSDVTITFEKQ